MLAWLRALCTLWYTIEHIFLINVYISITGREHWNAIKWFFEYLKGMAGLEIASNNQNGSNLVMGYVNAHYVSNLDERKLTIRYAITLVKRSIL